MTSTTDPRTSTEPLGLAPIARPSGALAMVAMDQRESLRAMFDAAGRGRPTDDVLVDFKADVARVLGPLASGFLVDRHYGYARVRDLLPPSAGLILAADALAQADGGPVEETDLDDAVLAPDFDLRGVAALKLLIIWRRDARREARVALAERFVAAARERGLLSVLEPVVRATQPELDAGTWDGDEAIREAARELAPLRPSLYKAQVPLAGHGDAEKQEAASAALGACIPGPWVVLSQGVDRERFLPAVEAACRGGASGFLAGRALWSDVVGADDVPALLRARSVPRLERLVEVVDREARPWSAA
jgi:sulfofructosephosphate aldolase